tara:strand:- start:106 stop:693 length:588 start_codon:yes stop_codon:yes gene_type:complete
MRPAAKGKYTRVDLKEHSEAFWPLLWLNAAALAVHLAFAVAFFSAESKPSHDVQLVRVRTVASNSAKLAKTRHESVVTNTHAWDTWAGSEWSVHKRAAKECSPRYHRMAMSTRGRVTAAVRRGSPSLRAPFRSYRRTLSGARHSLLGNPSGCRGGRLLPETLLGAGTDAPSETLLGAEGEGVTHSSFLREKTTFA